MLGDCLAFFVKVNCLAEVDLERGLEWVSWPSQRPELGAAHRAVVTRLHSALVDAVEAKCVDAAVQLHEAQLSDPLSERSFIIRERL
jgi:hypothetical protein